jgi:MFS transporter, DHA2 family, multidrug resistance protein
MLHGRIPDAAAAKGAALGMLAQQVRREATVMAYADGFWLVGAGLVLSLGVIGLLRRPARMAGPVEAH